METNNSMITKIEEWTKAGSLDRAILIHMYRINSIEGRPTSFIDFKVFEGCGRKFAVAHGTFRNKISKWIKQGIVRLVFNSKIGFYALTEIVLPSDKMMTGNGTVVSSVTNVIPVTARMTAKELLGYLKSLDSKGDSIHDIHTKFTVPDIYTIFSANPVYAKLINPISKDIKLEIETIDDLRVCTTIHRTDTVTVSVACSRFPIKLNEEGITRLSCALTRIEERLSRKLDECGIALEGGYERIPIPRNERWQVTLWHFGKDKFLNEFPSKGYALTWGHGREVLRCYLKTKNVERMERQESPNKTMREAISEKIGVLY